MGVGLVFYWMIKPVLRRRAAEGEGNESRGIEQPLEDDNSMPQNPVDLIQVKEVEIEMTKVDGERENQREEYIDFT